ncbi:AFG1-like ATPase family protein, putative, expressed [Zostera marina]|uniref:AFG1-like ATPase family protein, putative, expressed n=1 Tax=Zostera marina TaxID=29655 RepID=A0A0K9PHW7_ZOSMR|nr:AFG1-like ATPase family protein, putative, expressed [Zostera marina]
MVRQGKLRHDPNQERVAKELDKLLENLHRYEREMEEYHENLAAWEMSRENERRQLLLNDAELKQQDKSISKKRHEHAEPGVGKMVSYFNREKKLDSLIGRRPIAPSAPKGLYLYGNVGSGKTMLMDMFYKSTECVVKHRRRFHFHEAMLEIHEHMHDVWKNRVEENSFQSNIYNWISNLPFDSKVKEWLIGEEKYKQETQMKHILPTVADRFLLGKKSDQRGATILCFDEIQTIDVFAVVALSGILSRLLSTGTVLVATSNRLPEDLNQDGMQLDIFFKLVAKLEENCSNIFVGDEIDYRRLIPKNFLDQVQYFWPLDSETSSKFDEMWFKMISQFKGKVISETIPVMFGRKLEVHESCNGMARFNFEYLCGRPIGAADYIAIARGYHTVFISEIPAMSMRIRDKARRFITLVDELYNHHCCLYCSASVSIDDLFQGSEEGTLFDLESFQFETEIEGSKLRRDVLAEASIVDNGTSPSSIVSLLSGQEELFAFRRAVSRLIEMQTPLYLEGVRRLHPYFESNRK